MTQDKSTRLDLLLPECRTCLLSKPLLLILGRARAARGARRDLPPPGLPPMARGASGAKQYLRCHLSVFFLSTQPSCRRLTLNRLHVWAVKPQHGRRGTAQGARRSRCQGRLSAAGNVGSAPGRDTAASPRGCPCCRGLLLCGRGREQLPFALELTTRGNSS